MPAWAAGAEQASLAIAGVVRFEPLTAGGGPERPLERGGGPERPLERGGGLTVAGAGSYRGAIEVRPNGRGVSVVNDVSLEDYVRGIDEVPPSWPAAALQAQAIAARTYAAHKAVTGDTRWRAVGADICATPTCQVYRGLDAERKANGQGWLPAVEATAGRALLEGGRPIMASYNSTTDAPRAMSQNGALAMANEGRSATEILAAYYGLRPTLAPARLPSAIKVAVVMNTSKVRIATAAPLRVVDAAGAPLATPGAGEWSVMSGAGGVRLVPPEPPAPMAETAPAPEPQAVLRRASRVVTAAAPVPGPGGWAFAALVLAVTVGTSTITLHRRRRA